MRKFFTLVALLIFSTVYSLAQTDFWSEYLGFRVVGDNTVIVSETASPPDDVIIPSTVVNGDVSYNVIGVGNVFWDKDNIKSVVVSEGVQYLDFNAFGDCQGLSALVLPSTLERIGENAFVNDHALTAISCFGALPPALHNNAKDGSFWGVSWNGCFVYVADEAAVDAYKSSAWNGFANIVVMGNGFNVDGISYNVLDDGVTVGVAGASSDVTDVNIPETVSSFGKTYTVTSVENDAFKDNKNIVSVTLPKTIKNIGQSAFTGIGATSITFAEGTVVESVGDFAFSWAKSLKSIVLPEGIVDLPTGAFENSDAIESMTMPATLKSFRNGALTNCVKLATLVFTGDAAPTLESNFDGCMWAVKRDSTLFRVIVPYKSKAAYEAGVWNAANFKTVCYDFKMEEGAEYAGLYDGADLEIDNGVKIYTGRIVDSNLVLDVFEGSVIPATTPVILSGSCLLTPTMTGVLFTGTNDLQGVSTDMEVSMLGTSGILTLSNVEGKSVFAEYTEPTLAANSVFVSKAAAGEATTLAIVMAGDVPNAISTVEATDADSAVYTVDGIRTEGRNLKKGIYIRNGKKFVVK